MVNSYVADVAEVIAKHIKHENENDGSYSCVDLLEEVARELAIYFADGDSEFNSVEFLKDCGI